MNNPELFMSALLPILVILVIGIVVLSGWLVWVFTRRRGDRTGSAGLGTPSAGTEAGSALQSGPLYLLSVKPGNADAWDIYVQGIRYRSLDAVPDPKIRADVVAAAQQAAAFAGISTQTGAPAGQTPRPAPTEIPAPRATGSRSAEAVSAAGSMVGAEPAARRAAMSSGTMPVIDFAQEIGDIVEELLEQTPELQRHAVSLQNVPRGGIQFIVDGTVYEDISDIPSTEVQTLIRRATREWERR